jgi:hypothetical protein
VTFSEEFEHIKAAIYDNPRQDPGRLETCLSIALEALGDIADEKCECFPYMEPHPEMPYDEPALEPNPDCRVHFGPAGKAQAALRRMERRVKVGEDLRPGEHQTLDWDYPEPRWMETLSPGPEGGDWG